MALSRPAHQRVTPTVGRSPELSTIKLDEESTSEKQTCDMTMKFWEVLSAFRDDPNLLLEVFSSEKWRHPYLERYSSLKGWTETSRPSFLDDDVPLELAREIAVRYTKDTFLFYPAKQQIHMADKRFDVFPQEERISMTALEILDRFGGSLLEEILEKSSATISQD